MTRQYFDADKLIRTIYHKIAVWHNNDERLNDIEMGRELRFLSQEIAEDVLKAVHGPQADITLDKHKLGMTAEELEKDALEREKRRSEMAVKLDEDVQKADDQPPS